MARRLLTWRGTDLGCDVALRPRGRARAAHAGRAGGADAWQEATRTVHVGARVGRHVAAGGSHVEGPRVSGPW